MLKKILRGAAIGTLLLVAVAALLLGWAEHRARLRIAAASVKGSAAPLEARPAANALKNAYFGETHLHTSLSMDAGVLGTENTPRMAYRFAQGDEVRLSDGQRQRLLAPLDFAAVTDHAEGMGAYAQCANKDSASYWSINCMGMRYQAILVFPRLIAMVKQIGDKAGTYDESMCGPKGSRCIADVGGVWQDVQAAANEAYRPGRFTSLIGFEYSPTLDASGMLHRNVLFRSSVVTDRPFSAFDGFPEDMLRWLDASCKGDCQALSIPHNPNWSWGLMFGETNGNAAPLTRADLALRARMETLIEVFQAKGSSECAFGVGNNDEQCGFENMWPVCKPGEEAVDKATGLHARRCVASNDMVRNVLRKGLLEEQKYGFNPYKFGFVAGTDNHNGTPGDTEEGSYKGHGGNADSDPRVRLGLDSTVVTRSLGFASSRLNPGGLTGVWAEENTREAIFDALRRKESFGTSGTRLRVRLFGGFGFAPNLHQSADMVKAAYAGGVPMGGDLKAAQAGQALSLLVWATRDPNSAPLQRIQIVKGWLDAGTTHEQVYDVVCADGIVPDPATHQCRDNGARVDPRDCTISKDKGAPELATTWRDPDFHAGQSAFYYARVLENPVCRYTQHDANRLGVALPAGVAGTTQERAWTSPIWYSPAR
ncbi:MAG: DUF3604 domain-containing protein [Pseudomonadota bacterium]